MITYIIRRLLWLIVVVFLVSVIVFFSIRLLPGDPVLIYAAQLQSGGSITQEQLDRLRVEHGLDKPVLVQFVNWLGGILKGDLGKSIRYHDDVGKLMRQKFPVTIYLGVVSMAVATLFGIFFGLMAAIRRGTWIDSVVTVLSYIGLCIPVFLLAFALIYVLALKLDLLPIVGYTHPWVNYWTSVKQSIMPVICLAVTPMAVTARQMRSSVLEVANMDYVRTAWSKGLRERLVVTRHILKNSLIPVITTVGIGVGLIFGGSVIIESIFAIPGVGQLLVNSIFARDYVVIQSGTLVVAFAVILVNLIVDISYGWLDPRIRYE